MAGNQVLEWTDFDTAIKTAGLKNVRGSFNDIRGGYSDKEKNRIPWLPLICEYIGCPGYAHLLIGLL
jgi:hypothetical protein